MTMIKHSAEWARRLYGFFGQGNGLKSGRGEMRLFFSNALIFIGALLVVTSAVASPIAGKYVLRSKDQSTSGHFEVTDVQIDHATLKLYRTLGYPQNSSYCCVRTGSLEGERIRISGDIGLYEGPASEQDPCVIVIAFAGRSAQVEQFGACGIFGAGVTASGRYVRVAAAPGP